MITIKLNGKEEQLEKPVSVQEFLDSQDVKMLQYVSVQINDEIVDRDDFETTIINDNDVVETLYFMGGGQA